MLAKVTLALFFLLLVWGNLVAGMKAGLGCPDWPLCHGRVVPPVRLDTYMEWGHRVIAAAAMTALAVLGWKRLKVYKGWARAVPVAAFALVAFEAVLGGFVVLLGLPMSLTTLHFMAGLAVFALVYCMSVFDGTVNAPAFSVRGAAGIFLAVAAAVYFQAALGAYVRHSGSGLSCPDIPTCLGALVPPVMDKHVLAHYTHRVLGLLVGMSLFALYTATFLDSRLRLSHRPALILVLLALLQLVVGASVVLTGLDYSVTALHMAVALLMLIVLMGMWAREVRRTVSENSE